MTKGIILSGGWGKRLRPLTCMKPKTLIPVVNKPVIERQMLMLKEAGVHEIILAVSVMSEELKQYFKDGQRLGIKIHYTKEEHPMGTAGAIKLAEDFLADDNFFMLNGDVIFNYDFRKILQSHEQYGGIGIIGSRMVEDPSRYGVLITDDKTHQILKFLEKEEYKPPKGKQIPMPVNAGVYLLEPKIFSYIPSHKKVSIEKEVFPEIVAEEKLYYHEISGIWKDMGNPDELMDANMLLLKDLLKNDEQKNFLDETLKLEGKVYIYPPVAIGANTLIRNNSKIGPNVVIGNNVYIDEETVIKDSLIYDEVYISKNVDIQKSIISDNCYIHDEAILRGNESNLVILASYVTVQKNRKLMASATSPRSVCHHEVVKEDLV